MQCFTFCELTGDADDIATLCGRRMFTRAFWCPLPLSGALTITRNGKVTLKAGDAPSGSASWCPRSAIAVIAESLPKHQRGPSADDPQARQTRFSAFENAIKDLPLPPVAQFGKGPSARDQAARTLLDFGGAYGLNPADVLLLVASKLGVASTSLETVAADVLAEPSLFAWDAAGLVVDASEAKRVEDERRAIEAAQKAAAEAARVEPVDPTKYIILEVDAGEYLPTELGTPRGQRVVGPDGRKYWLWKNPFGVALPPGGEPVSLYARFLGSDAALSVTRGELARAMDGEVPHLWLDVLRKHVDASPITDAFDMSTPPGRARADEAAAMLPHDTHNTRLLCDALTRGFSLSPECAASVLYEHRKTLHDASYSRPKIGSTVTKIMQQPYVDESGAQKFREMRYQGSDSDPYKAWRLMVADGFPDWSPPPMTSGTYESLVEMCAVMAEGGKGVTFSPDALYSGDSPGVIDTIVARVFSYLRPDPLIEMFRAALAGRTEVRTSEAETIARDKGVFEPLRELNNEQRSRVSGALTKAGFRHTKRCRDGVEERCWLREA